MALSDSSSAMNRGRNFLNKFTDDGEPIRFAFYNTLFFLLLAVCFAGIYAVYQMFNIFFMPILWATLIGTVIFPIKRTISFYLNGWLLRLDESNTPMMLGICLIPMNALTGISRLLYENLISAHGIYYILAYVALKVLSYNGTLVHLLGFAGKVYSFCDLLLAFITQNWFIPLVILYSSAYAAWIYVQDTKNLHDKKKFGRALIFVLAYISSYCGIFRVIVFAVSTVVLTLISLGIIHSSDMPSSEEIKKNEEKKEEEAEELEKKEAVETMQKEDTVKANSNRLESTVQELNTDKDVVNTLITSSTRSSLGNNYIRAMFLLCLLLWTAKHDSVLIVVISLILFAAGLSFIDRLDVPRKLYTTYRESATNEYVNRIANVTVPGALRQFFYILFTSDKYLIIKLKKKVDLISSLSVMIIIFLGTASFLVFTVFSLHGETVHLAKLTSNVLSSNPEWLKTAMNFTEEQLKEEEIDNYAYQQSRIWLASNIRSLADPKDTKRADQLERQAKMLVDNLYHLWEERSVLMSSNASQTTAVSRGDWLGQLMSASNLETLKSEIVLVVKENIETVISVLSSLWRVVSLNLGLFYSVAWTILGFIFGFGFDLLNFFIEIIVFLTVVYYLLASSNEQWLPLRWISDIEPSIQPTNSKVSISSAIESAISSVFVLSAKMSIFYGLYTYFVHTVFDLHITFIPSLFAAGLASVPVVPPYAVAIFGAIELYAVRAETAATVVFCLVSIAPLFFADLTFYSEVKNSHPYITGLAVLGGVNCFGIQGAIIGPIVLCTLIVVINVYAEFAKKR
ncbi:hypothetical protein M3Y96_00792800 [Aphelenchoides besseyi]|nr:hypothetical protein M3Y96_00792800 [Aphelenchoides besseyi]